GCAWRSSFRCSGRRCQQTFTWLYAASHRFRRFASARIGWNRSVRGGGAHDFIPTGVFMSIGSIDSSSMLQYTQGAQSAQRPDPSQFAQKLFSQIDTSGQGYLDKSELRSALDKVSLSQSGMAMSADDLMAKLDANGDGKVTEGEF